MTDNLVQKSSEKFHCKKCDYYTSRKSQYDRHILTPKHKNTDKILPNTDAESSESSKNAAMINNFICSCGKEYKHRQSLFNHKKKCQTLNINNEEINNIVSKYDRSRLEFKNLSVAKERDFYNLNCNHSHNIRQIVSHIL